MNKKKGFTLIELLAVIVILAVLALVTIYVIGDVIEQSKVKKYFSEEKSMETAAGLYLVKHEGMLDRVIDSQVITLKTLVDSEVMKAVHDSGNGGLCDQEQSKVLVSVDKENRLVTYTGCLKCSNYQTKNADCGFVEDKKLCELEEKNNIYYIDSEEDLYAFSKSVNSGNNYSGKTVKLRKNLDMSKSIDTIKTSCGEDVASFDPIGNNKTSSNRFAGTFEGDGYYIRNLTINKPTDDYVGLFGYSTGVIKGINIENADINGKDNVGGVAGYISSTSEKASVIQDTKISGSVIGHNYVGGVLGRPYGNNAHVLDVISNMTIEGNKYVGGISGTRGNLSFSGVIESGSLTSLAGRDSYSRGYVAQSSESNSCSSVLVNENFSANGVNRSDASSSYCGGTNFESTYLNRLNGYDEVIDTYIGGDNNSSGYYFDYDSSNNIVVKSTSRNPLPQLSSLSGSGTEEDPYKISSVEDYNVAVVYPTGKNYELTANLDFNNKEIYMLGSVSNKFTEKFDGNGYHIKNFKIKGMNYTGLFGYSNGIIKGLNIENADINGRDNVGGVAGYIEPVSEGSSLIQDIKITGNITGHNSVGGVLGSPRGNNVYVLDVITNMNISANKYVGGISGTIGNLSITGVIESGSLTSLAGSDSYSRGYVAQSSISDSCSSVLVNENFSANGVNRSDASSSYCGGKTLANAYVGRLNGYDEVIDTYIGGDNNSSGYYYDYDSNNNVAITSVKVKPLPQLSSLSGAGTLENPYKISSKSDWDIAVVYPTGYYYELTSDIDFNNEEIYMLGSVSNKFTKTFNGNNHKIKNARILGNNYTGLFGYVTGKVKDLNIEGINVDGYDITGGLIGAAGLSYNTNSDPCAKIDNITFEGTTKGHNSVGGLIGNLLPDSEATRISAIVNVTGNSKVGGLGGGGKNFSGMITAGTITGNEYTRFVSAYFEIAYVRADCSSVIVAADVTLDGRTRAEVGDRAECDGNVPEYNPLNPS